MPHKYDLVDGFMHDRLDVISHAHDTNAQNLDGIEPNVTFKDMKMKCENSNSSNMKNSLEKKKKENNILQQCFVELDES
jgi:hypothetical protein